MPGRAGAAAGRAAGGKVRPEADGAGAGEAVVVVNRRSRDTAAALKRLPELLHAHGVAVAAFHAVDGSSDVRRVVRRAAKAGARAVVVGGGDGTMAHAVDVLAHRDTVLGVLPLGTGNSFAQSLAIPIGDLEAAVEVVARRRVERVDLGCVNGTHFANFATVGLSSIVAGDTSTRVKGLFGRLAYAFAALVPLVTHRGFRARIRWHGGKLDVPTQDVVIGNGRFFGSAPIAPDAEIADGRLTLFVAEGRSAFAALRTFVAFGLHAQTHLPGAHVVSAKRLTIRATPKQRIAIDGSLFERTPAHVRVAPRALRAFVP